jgi:hypothetical protein
MYPGPVRPSPELYRILNLPRRVETAGQWERLALEWTPRLLNPAGLVQFNRIMSLPQEEREAEFARFARRKDEGGENCPLLISALQAQALFEFFHCGGGFASAAVGVGKTLLSWLLALIIQGERVVLLVPASVEQQTHDNFADLSRFWQAPRPPPVIETYETVGGLNHAGIFCSCERCLPRKPDEPEPANPGLRPTHIIADECDLLRNPTSKRFKRVARYMAKHPTTCYYGMTGTPVRKSIRNFAPQLIWALKLAAPVPLHYNVTQVWCEAIDETDNGPRRSAGALLEFYDAELDGTPANDDGALDELEAARRGFARRLQDTPGYISSDEQSCDQPLTVRFLKAPDDPILDRVFDNFRGDVTPDGWDIEDPLEYFRIEAQLGAGFYLHPDPRPPVEWLAARKGWALFVREQISRSQRSGRPLDSAADVARAFPEHPAYKLWREVEPTFKLRTVPVPLSASVLGYAAEWLRLNSPALVWVQHRWVGETLSAMSRVPYFGPKGKTETGLYIMDHSPRQSAICSIHANKRGRNLQAWNRGLVIAPPQAATDWEQCIFGRMHRQGQTQPVHLDVLISCAANLHAVAKAYAEAGFAKIGGPTQKLLIANYDWSAFPAAELRELGPLHPSRNRWTRPRMSRALDAAA